DRRGDAPRRASEGCGDHRAEARGEEHDREAAAELERAAEFRPELLHAERERRIRGRRHVRGDVRRLHGEWRADRDERHAVRRQRDRLNPMDLETLGHASLLIRDDAGAPMLLTDPWLTGSCYWRSWWLQNYPQPPLLDGVNQVPFCFITHEHPDHFHT